MHLNAPKAVVQLVFNNCSKGVQKVAKAFNNCSKGIQSLFINCSVFVRNLFICGSKSTQNVARECETVTSEAII